MNPKDESSVDLGKIAREASNRAVRHIFKKGLRASIYHNGVIYKVAADGTAYSQNNGQWFRDTTIRFDVKGGEITVCNEAT